MKLRKFFNRFIEVNYTHILENQDIQTHEKHSFNKNIEVFVENIESLSINLPIVLGTIEETLKKSLKIHQDFLERNCKKEKKNGKTFYIVKQEHLRRNQKLRKEVNYSNIAHQIIQRNFIVSLVSQYDSFLGGLIRAMYFVKPELIDASDKKLTFSNLVDLGSVQEARDFIIEKEIDAILRGSHSNQLTWFENKIGKIRDKISSWSDFIELTERRNLFVHNNGKVTNQYLRVCHENGVKFEEEVKLEDNLLVGPSYFEKAFKCVFEIGVLLAQTVWRKFLPENLEEADSSIVNLSYELIHKGEYELAIRILDFFNKYIKDYSSQDLQLRLLLNRAQAYKWSGDSQQCAKILDEKDWSACNDVFKLATQVLKNDYENAYLSMSRLGSQSDEIDKLKYKEWPIFKEIRKEEKFKMCFKSVFNEQFELSEAIAESGYRITDEAIFLATLKECLSSAAKRENGFVGSRFIVEKVLADRGYDISSSWDMFYKLEEKGIIETYNHEDPTGKYFPLNSVKMKADK
ncbi:hypothetical protein [Flagellimonas nanhaiensis]|nr:hypothetical protein [Allomuricauda nanhaiensis]